MPDEVDVIALKERFLKFAATGGVARHHARRSAAPRTNVRSGGSAQGRGTSAKASGVANTARADTAVHRQNGSHASQVYDSKCQKRCCRILLERAGDSDQGGGASSGWALPLSIPNKDGEFFPKTGNSFPNRTNRIHPEANWNGRL